MRVYNRIRQIPPEAWIWTGGLLVFACMNPSESHYSFCVFKHLGLPWCPGCGLGRSVSYLFHGDLAASFHAHPLGIFAVAVLGHRIWFLVTAARPAPVFGSPLAN